MDTKRKSLLSPLGVLAAGLLISSGAWAQGINAPDVEMQAEGDERWTLGMLLGYWDKPYDDFDDDEKVVVAPLIMFEGERVYFRLNQLGFRLTPNNPFQFDLAVKYNGMGYDSGDSSALRFMDDREGAIEAGGKFSWSPQPLGFGIKGDIFADVSDEHEGWHGSGSGFYRHGNQRWVMTYQGGVVYQSDDMVDYYFGVRPSEEIEGVRPAYEADEAVNFKLAATLLYRFDSPWNLIAHLEYQFLDDEIDDSPIVEDDTQFIGAIGLGYRF